MPMIQMSRTIVAIFLVICPAFAVEYHVAVTGSDGGDGSESKPFKTISAAARVAQPGDIITVHEGVYRERVNPPRGGLSDEKRIVYRAASGEKVEIKGSEVIKGWEKVGHDTWKVTVPNSFFNDYNPYRDVIGGEWYGRREFPRHTGTVYLNGDWMDEAPDLEHVLAPAGERPCWHANVDATNTTIWAQFKDVDPNAETVEINVRRSVFYPDQPGRDFITVRGFIMRDAATPWAGAMSEQVGLLGTHWSKGWIIEDNVISHSVCTGITLGRCAIGGSMPPATAPGYVESIRLAVKDGWSKEKIGGHIVRNNDISHCEKNGIHGSLGGIFSVVEGNAIHDIATRRWLSGADIAGLKLLGSIDTVIRNNHIYRCGGSAGIWLDWMAQGTRVTGNLLHDNKCDLFVEVDHGPFLIDNNLFLSRTSLQDWSQGSSYVHNLFAGRIKSRTEGRQTPWFKPHTVQDMKLADIQYKDARFFNNLLTGDDQLASYGVSEKVQVVGNALFGQNRTRLEERGDGWWLAFRPDPAWAGEKRPLVTTELLGKAHTPGQPFEQPDGTPYCIDSDYFSRRRPSQSPAPGPFQTQDDKELFLKVWPSSLSDFSKPDGLKKTEEKSNREHGRLEMTPPDFPLLFRRVTPLS